LTIVNKFDIIVEQVERSTEESKVEVR